MDLAAKRCQLSSQRGWRKNSNYCFFPRVGRSSIHVYVYLYIFIYIYTISCEMYKFHELTSLISKLKQPAWSGLIFHWWPTAFVVLYSPCPTWVSQENSGNLLAIFWHCMLLRWIGTAPRQQTNASIGQFSTRSGQDLSRRSDPTQAANSPDAHNHYMRKMRKSTLNIDRYCPFVTQGFRVVSSDYGKPSVIGLRTIRFASQRLGMSCIIVFKWGTPCHFNIISTTM